jgi:hypothetical protein
MKNIIKKIESLNEYGQFHNEECCVNYEDSRACDFSTPILGCCEEMVALAEYSKELVETVIDYLSYDIFKNEEQRKAGVKMYLEHFEEEYKKLIN